MNTEFELVTFRPCGGARVPPGPLTAQRLAHLQYYYTVGLPSIGV